VRVRGIDQATDVDIAVVRWPADAAARTQLAAERTPRVLLVAPGMGVPPPVDDLEDWLREPFEPAELLARTDALRRRVSAHRHLPHLDDDGLLHFRGRWVAISDSQVPMVRLLVARFGQLVRTDELTDAYAAAGGTKNISSVRTAITRVRNRVAEVGLALEVARHRGVVLQAAG
jgi:hypothetical protein